MKEYTVDETLTFEFNDDWLVTKYDEWSYYRNQFIKISDGTKAVDLLAISPDHTLWLIEVKNYRRAPRTKEMPIREEILKKVCDTLAAILPAQCNASDDDEYNYAKEAVKARKIRIILYWEQSKHISKLFPQKLSLPDIQNQLKIRLKPIDPHPKVVDAQTSSHLPWRVRV